MNAELSIHGVTGFSITESIGTAEGREYRATRIHIHGTDHEIVLFSCDPSMPLTIQDERSPS